MATARPTSRGLADENAVRQVKPAAGAGSKRRALGDIGNVATTSGAHGNQQTAADKAGTSKKQQQKQQSHQQQLAQETAPPAQQQLQQAPAGEAPARLTRSRARALAQGTSLSSMLQARGAAATAPTGNLPTRRTRRSGSLSGANHVTPAVPPVVPPPTQPPPRQQQQQQQSEQVQQKQQQHKQDGPPPPTRAARRQSGAHATAAAQEADEAAAVAAAGEGAAAAAAAAAVDEDAAEAEEDEEAEQQQQQPPPPPLSPLPDIDGPDRRNHLAECGYVNDIYGYFRRVEPRYRAPPDYMARVQQDVNEKMRAILVDWLVEVHLKFKLMPESLFLTVNLIDRYLAVRPVTRKNLQLVGVTAMLVAAKYEEIWAPEVRDFVYISDKAYTRRQILDTEKDMLAALDYCLSLPTSYQFLARLLKAAGVHYDKHLALFVAYSAELCLVDYRMLRYGYSELAAGIMYVAMRAFKRPDPYPRALMRHAHHELRDVLHVAKDVVRLVQAAPGSSLQAVVKKYSTPKFCEAAQVAPPLEILDE